MPIDRENLSRVVLAFTAPGEFVAVGQMIGIGETPTAHILLADGTQISWQAHLCREATPAEAAIVQALVPAQNTCTHEKAYGRLTRTTTVTVCGRCRKAMSE
jgi:hypothetical protein